MSAPQLLVGCQGGLPGRLGECLPLPPGLLRLDENTDDPGGRRVHVTPRGGELLVPAGSFGVGGGPALMLFADDVLVGGPHLQAGQSQVLGDVGGRPASFLLIGGASQVKLPVAAAPQVNAVDAAERSERSM